MHPLDFLISPFVCAIIVALILSLVFAAKDGLKSLWRQAATPGGAVFVIAAALLCAYAGQKGGDGNARRRLSEAAMVVDTVSADEIARGYADPEPIDDGVHDYSMPTGACLNVGWFLHGAYEDWFESEGYAVFTDGLIRPKPRDLDGQIAAHVGPMLALQGESRSWTARLPSGATLFTWANFFLNADTNTPVNLQIELQPSGDYIVRSNEVAYVHRRIVPADWDADGIPNGLDPWPCHKDGDYFGSTGMIPEGADPRAYYAIDLVLPQRTGEILVQAADGEGVTPDEDFIARAGTTNTVFLAYGVEYTVWSDETLTWGGSATEPAGVSRGDAHTLYVFRPIPACTACANPACDCVPWLCSGAACGCCPEDPLLPRAVLDLPRGVFKFGERRPLTVSLEPAGTWAGRVSVNILAGASRVSLFASPEGDQPAELPQNAYASTFASYQAYVAHRETSGSLDDVVFELRVEDPDAGACFAVTQAMTSVEVSALAIQAPEWTTGPSVVDFTPHEPHVFDVTNSLAVSPHLPIYFCDALNTNGATSAFAIKNFSVRAFPRLVPAGYVEMAQWEMLRPTPPSGSLAVTTDGSAELRNPRMGGVYRIGCTIGGTPRCEGNVVLPLSGASTDSVLVADLAHVDEQMQTVDMPYLRDLQVALIGAAYLSTPYAANYCGRSDNAARPTVWHYNQVATDHPITQSWSHGMGSVTTICGVPVQTAKVTNYLVGYAAQILDAPEWQHDLGQLFGTGNDASADFSWRAGAWTATNACSVAVRTVIMRNIWRLAETRYKRLWPNEAVLDNYSTSTDLLYRDYDHYYYSPRFLRYLRQNYRIYYDLVDMANGIWRDDEDETED